MRPWLLSWRTICIDISARRQADRFFNAANNIVVLDFLPSATTAKAHIVLPAAAFAEANGTLVNNEGRAQRFLQVFEPQPDIQESWRWIREIGLAAGRADTVPWGTFDEIVADLADMPRSLVPSEISHLA